MCLMIREGFVSVTDVLCGRHQSLWAMLLEWLKCSSEKKNVINVFARHSVRLTREWERERVRENKRDTRGFQLFIKFSFTYLRVFIHRGFFYVFFFVSLCYRPHRAEKSVQQTDLSLLLWHAKPLMMLLHLPLAALWTALPLPSRAM